MTGKRVCLACAKPNRGYGHADHDPVCGEYTAEDPAQALARAPSLAAALRLGPVLTGTEALAERMRNSGPFDGS